MITFPSVLVHIHFYPNYPEQNYLDRDLYCDLDCYLDHSPKDAPIITGHSLFNITKGHIVVHCCHRYIAIHLIS